VINLDTTTTSLIVPRNLRDMAKEKGINMSKVFAEALAKELDTGREFERLKEKEKIYERKLEIIRQEIQDCEILMQEKQKHRKTEQEKADEIVETIMERIRLTQKIPNELIQIKSKQMPFSPEVLEKLIRKQAEREGIILFE